MSIATKLVTIAENEQKVYAAGQKAEYDRFWDNVQNYGNRTSYINGFSGASWNDKTYNPKYPIVCNSLNDANNLFLYNGGITDIKVSVELRGTNTQNAFANLHIQRVPLVILVGVVKFIQTFNVASSLTYIRFNGEIQNNINFQWSPLDVDSMKNIISCLANFAGTANEFSYEIKFNDECWAALEASGVSPTGKTWIDYVNDLGWIT